MKKARRILFALPVVVCGWMAYDNVLSDEAPIKKLAEDAACAVKKCSEQHGMTRMARTPFGQSFDYTWREGKVTLVCHREYYVAGARKCTVE